MPTNKTILLGDLNHTYSVDNRSLFIPLNIGYIKAYTNSIFGKEISISLYKEPEKILEDCFRLEPMIVGLSNYGWNANLNQKIGQNIRKMLPATTIVAGGPNIDTTPESRAEFFKKHSYIDFVIIDNGEEPFVGLVNWLLEGEKDYSKLPSNICLKDGRVIPSTQKKSREKLIKDVPSPYLDGSLDEFLSKGMVPMLETNRGCPYSCTFCAWGIASKNKVNKFDLDVTLEEIEYIGRRSTALNWMICDANFGILKRDIEIAKAIRRVKDETGFPKKCHLLMAKNVTDRNLEIANILGDMIVPVMAIQSMDSDVLKNIKRGNIKLKTYTEYHDKYQAMGSDTFSEIIIPLPGETMASHLKALRKLTDIGTNIIFNHNLRMLAGAETNSEDSREKYKLKTKYRLTHGDAGIYKSPTGEYIRVFEYEESVRSTSTFTEKELFFLRKLHFFIELAWNLKVFKPLFDTAHMYGINAIDIMVDVINGKNTHGIASGGKVKEFFKRFDNSSINEWFETPKDIEDYFHNEENFQRLIDREFDKLNIQFSVILLAEYKNDFNQIIQRTLSKTNRIPEDILTFASEYCFKLFPGLAGKVEKTNVELPTNIFELNDFSAQNFVASKERTNLELYESAERKGMYKLVDEAINNSAETTLSKVLNARSFGALALRDLQLTVKHEFGFSAPFRRAITSAQDIGI